MENIPTSDDTNLTPPPEHSRKKLYMGIVGAIILIAAGLLAYKYLPSPKPAKQIVNEPKLDFTANYSENRTPLKDVQNFEAIKQKYGLNLSAAQEKYLDENRFLLVDEANTNLNPGPSFDDFLTNFDALGGGSIYNRKPEDTKLVTPDVVLHAYHKFFEMTLEQLEQKELAENLGNFLTGLRENLTQAASQNSGELKTRYQNLLAQITTAEVLFENKNPKKPDFFESPEAETAYTEQDKTIDNFTNAKTILAKYSAALTPELTKQVETELGSIYEASAVGVSPLFGQYSDTLKTDYTQFTPRSHYTKNSALRAYFRTMMYLGRSSYFFQKDVGISDANLLTQQFTVRSASGVTPLDDWQKIMAVTGFYAGQSDDLTYSEWNDFQTKVLGSQNQNADYLISQNTVTKLADNLNQVRLPKILSDVVVDENIFSQTKSDLLRKSLSFRIFGQRFTQDAWILNDLTAGQEDAGAKLPSTPSAVFVPAVLGDARAQAITQDFLKKDAGFSSSDVDSFMGKFNAKQSDITKVTKPDWFASMSSAWLYTLGSLTHDYGKSYPLYMQSTPFQDKQIQTFLGSYTELKHDTLLYAKQSYAEKGGGGDDQPIPPVVKGFVEPNMDFWNRLNELVANTQNVFTKNNLFEDSSVTARLQNFKEISQFYSDFAKQELQGKTISDDDYEKLRTMGLSFMAQPFTAEDPDQDSGQTALIADIHTDALKEQVLYEADAKPYLMLAIVGNENSPRVVASLVYNHYEFTNPLGGKRLTDEDWKNWVYTQTEKLPAKNFWYDSLLAK